MRIWHFTTLLMTVIATIVTAAGAAEAADVDETTKAAVQEAIHAYIEEDLARKETFLILDPRSGEPLSLAFDHVHSGVYPYEQDAYRACVDFMDAADVLYDVDFTVAIDEDGEATVDEIWVHKVGGEAVKK